MQFKTMQPKKKKVKKKLMSEKKKTMNFKKN